MLMCSPFLSSCLFLKKGYNLNIYETMFFFLLGIPTIFIVYKRVGLTSQTKKINAFSLASKVFLIVFPDTCMIHDYHRSVLTINIAVRWVRYISWQVYFLSVDLYANQVLHNQIWHFWREKSVQLSILDLWLKIWTQPLGRQTDLLLQHSFCQYCN